MAPLPPFPPRFLRETFTRIKTSAQANYQALITRMQAGGLKGLSRSVNTPSLRWPVLHLNLERAGGFIGGGFTLLSILIGGVLILHIAQLPYPNAHSIPTKGITLYSAHEAQQAYALFGSKPMELGAIQLRGVVVTGKTADGQDTGFVLLEIDGKAMGPVGVGENAGKGMIVQAIHPDGAILVYQGQKIDLTLSKATPKKTPTAKPSAPPSPGSNAPVPAPSDVSKPAS